LAAAVEEDSINLICRSLGVRSDASTQTDKIVIRKFRTWRPGVGRIDTSDRRVKGAFRQVGEPAATDSLGSQQPSSPDAARRHDEGAETSIHTMMTSFHLSLS
jgi:hypothetical protein